MNLHECAPSPDQARRWAEAIEAAETSQGPICDNTMLGWEFTAEGVSARAPRDQDDANRGIKGLEGLGSATCRGMSATEWMEWEGGVRLWIEDE